MYYILVIIFLRVLILVEGQTSPVAGHSYLLYNMYNGDNPYEYLAWTTSSSDANQASADDPGVFMEKSSAGSLPPRNLWTFDPQSDGSYYIYNTDNSYGSTMKRLDVRADGLTPFLEDDGDNPGQPWQLDNWGDGISFQLYNPFWTKNMDINGGGISNYPINGPFMNTPGSSLEGQHWQLADWTPTTTITISNIVTETQTITPPVQTSTIESSMTATITSIFLETQTETLTTTIAPIVPRNLEVRQFFVLTITNTVTSADSTSYTYTTLPASTIFVVSGGSAVTSTTTTTSTTTITTTTTYTASLTSSSAPMSSDVNSTSVLPSSTSDATGILAPSAMSSPQPSTTLQSTVTPSSGLTRDQQIAIGVGVPSVVISAIAAYFGCSRHLRKRLAS